VPKAVGSRDSYDVKEDRPLSSLSQLHALVAWFTILYPNLHPQLSSCGHRLINRIIDQAKTTALDVTNNVELRARNAGVPVDQYKKQAGEIASDLQKRVQEATGYVQDQAGKAKKQGTSLSSTMAYRARC